MSKRLLSIGLLAALAVAACGTSDSEPTPANPGDDAPITEGACVPEEPDCVDTGVVEVSDPLPVNPDGDVPITEGPCLAGEPECVDTVLVD